MSQLCYLRISEADEKSCQKQVSALLSGDQASKMRKSGIRHQR